MPETAADPTLSVQPGDVLDGKFRVDRILGEGGMGIVVAATHVALGQRVALKFMLPRALASADNVARFEREARAVVRLRSEHVARVSDVGRLGTGAPYIVMEFLEGQDLDQVLESHGALPIETAVDYVLQACEAIVEAHSLGIIHRDLKPTNLFLTTKMNGKALIKVLDFGISKSSAADDLSLTSTTQIMGSPNYMSPEQLRSARNVDARTDIWALGAILYELITRQVPFVADSVTQLTAMVVTEPPRPITDLRPDIPPDLAKAIMKCLEKSRDGRFQTVIELAAAIAPFASADGILKAGDIASTSGKHSIPKFFPEPASSSPRSAPAASTASAWDRTQLAPSGNVRPRRAPFVVGALAFAAFLGLGALFVSHRLVKTPAVPDDTKITVNTTTASNAIPSASPLPSTTSLVAASAVPTAVAINPPPTSTPSTKPEPHHSHSTMTSGKPKPDASIVVATPPTTTTSVAPSSTHPPALPNVRN